MSVYGAVEGCFSRHRRAVRSLDYNGEQTARILRLQNAEFFTALLDEGKKDKQFFVARLERTRRIEALYIVTRDAVEFASAPKKRWQQAMIFVTDAMEMDLAETSSISTSKQEAIQTMKAMRDFSEQCR